MIYRRTGQKGGEERQRVGHGVLQCRTNRGTAEEIEAAGDTKQYRQKQSIVKDKYKVSNVHLVGVSAS